MKNDDTTDQMLLLLTLIKEQREAIGEDRKQVEQFYADIQQGILEKVQKPLQSTNQKANQDLKKRIEELDRSIKSLNYRFILIYSSAFIALVFSFLLIFFLFVPSLNEIKERREEFSKLKEYSLDLSKCDGKTCVKVMTKQCGYGTSKDYCVIDPK